MLTDLLLPLELADNIEVPFQEEIKQTCSFLCGYRTPTALSKQPKLLEIQQKQYTISDLIRSLFIDSGDTIEHVEQRCQTFLFTTFQNSNEEETEQVSGYWETYIAPAAIMAFFTDRGQQWLFQSFKEHPEYFVAVQNLIRKELRDVTTNPNRTEEERPQVDNLRALIWLWTLLLILLGSKTHKFWTKDGNMKSLDKQHTIHQMIATALPESAPSYASSQLNPHGDRVSHMMQEDDELTIVSRLKQLIGMADNDSVDADDDQLFSGSMSAHIISTIIELCEETFALLKSKTIMRFFESAIVVSIAMNVLPVLMTVLAQHWSQMSDKHCQQLSEKLIEFVLFCVRDLDKSHFAIRTRYRHWQANVVNILVEIMQSCRNCQISINMLINIMKALHSALNCSDGQVFVNLLMDKLEEEDLRHFLTMFIFHENNTRSFVKKQYLLVTMFRIRAKCEVLANTNFHDQISGSPTGNDKAIARFKRAVFFQRIKNFRVQQTQSRYHDFNSMLDTFFHSNTFVYLLTRLQDIRQLQPVFIMHLVESQFEVMLARNAAADVSSSNNVEQVIMENVYNQLLLILKTQLQQKHLQSQRKVVLLKLLHHLGRMPLYLELTQFVLNNDTLRDCMSDFEVETSVQCFSIWASYLVEAHKKFRQDIFCNAQNVQQNNQQTTDKLASQNNSPIVLRTSLSVDNEEKEEDQNYLAEKDEYVDIVRQITTVVQQHLMQIQYPNQHDEISDSSIEYSAVLCQLCCLCNMHNEPKRWVAIFRSLLDENLDDDFVQMFILPLIHSPSAAIESSPQVSSMLTLADLQFFVTFHRNIVSDRSIFDVLFQMYQYCHNFTLYWKSCNQRKCNRVLQRCIAHMHNTDHMFMIVSLSNNDPHIVELVVEQVLQSPSEFDNLYQLEEVIDHPFMTKEQTQEVCLRLQESQSLSDSIVTLLFASSHHVDDFLPISVLFENNHDSWSNSLMNSICHNLKLSTLCVPLFLNSSNRVNEMFQFVVYHLVHEQFDSVIGLENWTAFVHQHILPNITAHQQIFIDICRRFPICHCNETLFNYLYSNNLSTDETQAFLNVILTLDSNFYVDKTLGMIIRQEPANIILCWMMKLRALEMLPESMHILQPIVSRLVCEVYSERTYMNSHTKELGSQLLRIMEKYIDDDDFQLSIRVSELVLSAACFANIHCTSLYRTFVCIMLHDLYANNSAYDLLQQHGTWMTSMGNDVVDVTILQKIHDILSREGSRQEEFSQDLSAENFIQLLLRQMNWDTMTDFALELLFSILNMYNATHPIHDMILQQCPKWFHIGNVLTYLTRQIEFNRHKARIYFQREQFQNLLHHIAVSLMNVHASQTYSNMWQFVLQILHGKQKDGLMTFTLMRAEQIVTCLLMIWQSQREEEVCLGTIQCLLQFHQKERLCINTQLLQGLHEWTQEHVRDHVDIVRLNEVLEDMNK